MTEETKFTSFHFLIDCSIEVSLLEGIKESLRDFLIDQMLWYQNDPISIHFYNNQSSSGNELKQFQLPTFCFLNLLTKCDLVEGIFSQSESELALEETAERFEKDGSGYKRLFYFPNPLLKGTNRVESELKRIGQNQIDVAFLPQQYDKSLVECCYLNSCPVDSNFQSNNTLSIASLKSWFWSSTRHFSLYAKVSFSLSSAFQFSVDIFSLFKESRNPYSIRINQSTQEIVQSRTHLVCNGESIDKEIIYNTLEIGDERVTFSSQEWQTMFPSSPSLTLVGFTELERIDLNVNLKKSLFVRSDDPNFVALIQSLKQLNRVAICQFISPHSSAPRNVALICPSDRLEGCGLYLKFLPFEEDLRDLSHIPACNHFPFLVEQFKSVIEEKRSKDSSLFPNSRSLAPFYNFIELSAERIGKKRSLE